MEELGEVNQWAINSEQVEGRASPSVQFPLPIALNAFEGHATYPMPLVGV